MRLSDYNYDLPSDRIAKEPARPRDHSRLMVINRKARKISHHIFRDLPDLLSPNDVVVLNETRVLPARLIGTQSSGRSIELLLMEQLEPLHWTCLAKPGKKAIKAALQLPENGQAEVYRFADDMFAVRFSGMAPEQFSDWLHRHGRVPIPPYFNRASADSDRHDYQTVYAKREGSVAAPTAGLHFTDDLLQKLRSKGVQLAAVTLHVGYGTFQPIQTEDLQQHRMHYERFEISPHTQSVLAEARARGARIIATGTTSARALESLPRYGASGKTDLFIKPGFAFQQIDGLITNFHLPQSTLLVLVDAFLQTLSWREVYEAAMRERYRFYSYGDAMLIT